MDNYFKNIIIQAQNGDSGAFAEIYSYYSSDLYRFAFYMLGNREDAQDAVQDAVIQAFKNMRALKKPDAFKSWLFKILSNCCKSRLSRAAEQGSPLSVDDIQDLVADSKNEDISASLELREALYVLSATERSIVLLSVIFGYSSREISDIFSIPSSTVRSKLSRSLLKLRTTLENTSDNAREGDCCYE